MNIPQSNPGPWRRYKILASIIVIAVVLGMLAAWENPLTLWRAGNSSDSSGQATEPVITDVKIGSVADPSKAGKNPKLATKSEYSTEESIGIHFNTAYQEYNPLQLQVRLVAGTGQITELNPSSFTLAPAENTFCCWKIKQAGKFSLQVFSPTKIITTIPLTINAKLNVPSIDLF